ncbi:hypothetical protein B9Z55_003401 [Caenorhabditis nigoni]|nr:hypothetical protein B9Z55_003401 [Caenorhabditis nigoni]
MKLLILSLFALFLTVNGCLRIRWPEKCSPTDFSVFLLAYSNDLNFTEVRKLYQPFGEGISRQDVENRTAATVRFDTKTKEDIVFHEGETLSASYRASRDYIYEREVDPSQSFDSSETGSDVMDMLERFINSHHPNICGSFVLVLMKRSPNEVDISKLVRKIREYRILLGIAVQVPSSGGLHPETMYNLAAQTNGQCAFSQELGKAYFTLPHLWYPNAYYSLNLKVSGTGTMDLPPITFKENVTVHLEIAVQSSATAESFQSFTISWVNTQSGTTGSSTRTREQFNNGTFTSLNSFKILDFIDSEAATYELKLDYNYSSEDTILIRMNSKQ